MRNKNHVGTWLTKKGFHPHGMGVDHKHYCCGAPKVDEVHATGKERCELHRISENVVRRRRVEK